MMDRERRIGLRGRRDIERERDTLLSAMYRRSSKAISIGGNRQTLTVEQWTQRERGEQRKR